MTLKHDDAHRFAVVLPAGGLGKRMGAGKPKQLLELAGKPVWKYSLETFLDHPRIGTVVLVVPAEWMSHFAAETQGLPILLVEGGAERWQSVQNGVAVLPDEAEFVLVHDVARPLLSVSIVEAVLAEVCRSACIVAKPVHDTVKIVNDGFVTATIDRSTVWLAQTPQACAVSVLRDLYRRAAEEGLDFIPTDEASLLERFGIPVAVVSGDSLNDKLTTPEDMERFVLALARRSVTQ